MNKKQIDKRKQDLHYNIGLMTAMSIALPSPTTSSEKKLFDMYLQLVDALAKAYKDNLKDIESLTQGQ